MKKSKYYSADKLMKYKAIYNMIIGQRANGKTYWWCDKSLDRYIEKGKCSAYLRRFDGDIKAENISELYSPHDISKKTKGEYNGTEYKKHSFTLVFRDEDGFIIRRDSKPFCFTYALNTWESSKGADKGDIDWILFDEFMTRRRYLTNEFITFQNILSSIIRNRTAAVIFMMANTVNKYCPYFAEMGLNRVSDMKPGDIDLYTFGESGLTVAVEMCPTSEATREVSKYYAFDNPQLEMITKGSWEIASYPHLSMTVTKEDILFKFYILFDKELICGDVISTGDYYLIHYHRHTGNHVPDNNDVVYVPVHDGALMHCVSLDEKRTKLHVIVSELIASHREFYSDNTVGEIVRNWKINQLRLSA